VNNVSRHFRKKEQGYLKGTLNDLETIMKVLYRGMYEFKKHHQSRTNLVRDEKCDRSAEFQSTGKR
jgi:hypothetical protein